MTRRQTRSYGFGTPSPHQLLLEGMLRAFAWLVSNVVSLSRTIFNRNTRDWHADETHEDQMTTPNDSTQKEPQPPQPSFSGKAAGRIPGIPVAPTQGTTPYSLAIQNQDARDKPEHDSLVVDQTGNGPWAVFPAKAGIQIPRKAPTSLKLALPPLIPTFDGMSGVRGDLLRASA